MYCKHCGKQIADDSKFCKHCGSNQYDSTTSPNLRKSSESLCFNKYIKKRNKLITIFLWSIVISICCALGYATINYEDSKPINFVGYFPENYKKFQNEIKIDKYKDGIRRTAICSFPIAFGVMVLGAILTGTMNKNNRQKTK